MKKVFIGCSSYENIPSQYFKEAKEVANITASLGYDLVFGATTRGLMGEIYKEYLNHPQRNIVAVCMKKWSKDLELIPDTIEKVLFNTTIEQMDYFMNCDKLIYLPGGYGTLTELIYLINAKANNIHNKDIIIINTTHFYDSILKHFDKLLSDGLISNNNLHIEIKEISELKKYL